MRNARRVLVVEDETSLAELARLYLERDGYVVDVAVDADSADRACRDHRPDVVLLDIGLPGPRDGIDLVRAMRSREDWTPVIFVTSATPSPKRSTKASLCTWRGGTQATTPATRAPGTIAARPLLNSGRGLAIRPPGRPFRDR